MIKTLFFDAAGTLFHLPRGVGWHYRDVAGRFGCALDAATLSQSFRTVWKQMPARPATFAPRPDDDRGWWFSLVEQVLDQCHTPPAQLPRREYFEQLYAEFTKPGIWELFPETREVLAGLHARYRLGVISNFDGRLRPILAHLGLTDYFDPVVISSEVGADKPDRRIFQRALALASTTAADSLHIGDDPAADWQGAHNAGLQVFRLQRPSNSLHDLVPTLAD